MAMGSTNALQVCPDVCQLFTSLGACVCKPSLYTCKAALVSPGPNSVSIQSKPLCRLNRLPPETCETFVPLKLHTAMADLHGFCCGNISCPNPLGLPRARKRTLGPDELFRIEEAPHRSCLSSQAC